MYRPIGFVSVTPGGEGYRPVEEPPTSGPLKDLLTGNYEPPPSTKPGPSGGSTISLSTAFVGASLFVLGAFFLGKRRP